MIQFKKVIFVLGMFLHSSILGASFGFQNTYEYFNLGAKQTSIVSIHTFNDKLEQGIGSGAVITSQVILTCAHVACSVSKGTGVGYVRFVDSCGVVYKIAINKSVYNPACNNLFKSSKSDVGQILLKSPVDINEFPPLKMNCISTDNLLGKDASVYGFSPSFGKLDANIILKEGNFPLRRGATIRFDGIAIAQNMEETLSKACWDGCLSSKVYHPVDGFVVIQDKEAEERSDRFNADSSFPQNIKAVLTELINPQEFIAKIAYGENLLTELTKIEAIRNLDMDQVLEQIRSIIVDQNIDMKKSFHMGKFSFYVFRPAPKYLAYICAGASGGPCLQDGSIVALASYASTDVTNEAESINMNSHMPVYKPFSYDQLTNNKPTISEIQEIWLEHNLSSKEGPYDTAFAKAYFEEAEKKFNNATKNFFQGNVATMHFTPLFHSLDWIKQELQLFEDGVWGAMEQ